jgi:hypothetical protein
MRNQHASWRDAINRTTNRAHILGRRRALTQDDDREPEERLVVVIAAVVVVAVAVVAAAGARAVVCANQPGPSLSRALSRFQLALSATSNEVSAASHMIRLSDAVPDSIIGLIPDSPSTRSRAPRPEQLSSSRSSSAASASVALNSANNTMTTSSVHIRRVHQMTTTTAINSQHRLPPAPHCASSGRHQRPAEVQEDTKAKALTNFSIESIIGSHHGAPTSERSMPPPETHHRMPESNGAQSNDCANNTGPGQRAFIIASGQQQQVVRSGQEVRKSRPKNFQCPVCGMAFSNNGQLKNHVRIHTGERPFICNQHGCGKTFTRNEELTRHRLIHTGVRPHACPSCPKRFGRKDHLKKHVVTHEKKRSRKSCYAPACTYSTHRDKVIDQPGAPLSPKKEPFVVGLDESERVPPAPAMHESTTKARARPYMEVPTTASGLLQHNRFASNADIARPLLGPTAPQLPPPVTFSPASQYIDPSTAARTMAAIASSTSLSMLSASTATSGPLQQLGDYWQEWYNFLGLYQQQQQP